MPSPHRASTAWGEQALHNIASRHADLVRLLDLEAVGKGGESGGRHAPPDSTSIRCANALVDTVAVCENFVTARLLAIRPSLPFDEVSTWKKRQRAWLNEASVDLASLPGWYEVVGFVEARNALQHGLGRLTELQLDRWRNETLKALATATVGLVGDRVAVDGRAAERCADACQRLIVALDAKAPKP